MRNEIKFIVAAHEVSYLVEWLFSKSVFDKVYPGRMVNSTYFDTPALKSAADNLSGVSRREKYRLRWYGSNEAPYGCRYETKQRVGNLGNKQTRKANFDRGVLAEQCIPLLNEVMVADEVSGFWKEFPVLKPTLRVQYHREYYEALDGIRLTLDDQLEFFSVPENCAAEVPGILEVREFPVKIVELKFQPERRDEVSQLLEDFPFYPRRCSKYVFGLSLFSKVKYL